MKLNTDLKSIMKHFVLLKSLKMKIQLIYDLLIRGSKKLGKTTALIHCLQNKPST